MRLTPQILIVLLALSVMSAEREASAIELPPPTVLQTADTIIWLGFNQTGTRLFACTLGGEAYVWTVGLWNQIQGLGMPGEVWTCAVSPDGRLLAIAADGGISIYSVSSRKKIFDIPLEKGDYPFDSTAFSPDGLYLATGRGKEVIFRRTANWRRIGRWKLPGVVLHLQYSHGGKLLGVVMEDGVMGVWNTETGIQKELLRTAGNIESIAFSPDETLLASANSVVHVWDTQSGKQVKLRKQVKYLDGVYGVAFSPDGKWLASNDSHGQVNLWSTSSWLKCAQLNYEVLGLDFSPDGRWLVGAGMRDGVLVWDFSKVKSECGAP
jgi:WD40 repeat protein